MLYIGNVPMMIPTLSTKFWLQAFKNAICEGCPAGTGVGTPSATRPFFDTVALLLNTNDVDPGAGLVYADLVLSDDTGAAAVQINEETPPGYCDTSFEGPGEGLDGYWRLVNDQVIWTSQGDGTTPPQITGLALAEIVDNDPPALLAYGVLPGGPANFEAGDIVKLVMDLVMRPQLPV